MSTIKIDIESSYDVGLPNLSTSFYKDNEALYNSMTEVKEKYDKSTSYNERVQLLTLLPNSWDFQKVSSTFNCSRYLFNAAQKLKSEKGINY